MPNDYDSLTDLGMPPVPLPINAPFPDVVRLLNQLNESEFRNRVSRHKHRTQLNDVVDEVRADLLVDMNKLAAGQQRIERGLFGDEYGQKGMVHRLEALETAAKSAPAPTTSDRVRVVATEWAIKIAVIILILVVSDYSAKAFGMWKAGVHP